jgi:serine phosphatase RsbU (regulator of sigma subunit)/anti-sigma regulatory factor (Ser/Thr protein kinase)
VSSLAGAGIFFVAGLALVLVIARIVELREKAQVAQRDLLLDRVTRLQELTSALSTAGRASEVVATAVRAIEHAVDADGVTFCRLDGDTVVVDLTAGFPDEVAARWTTVQLESHAPVADAIRLGEPVLCATRADILERYPAVAESLAGTSSVAIAALPLRGESSVFGAIGISFAEERSFEHDEVAFLDSIATQVATAYERATSFEAERAARRAAEAASERIAYLSEATADLTQSLDPETTMQRIAELAVPTLADWCAVHVVDGAFARPVALAGLDPSATAMVRELSQRNPVPIDAPAGLGAVVRTGEPIVLRRVTMEAVRASTDEREVVDLLSRLRSIAILPMKFGDEVVGTVTLSNTTDRRLEDADVALAGELAGRAAQAITNARLYAQRTQIAATLQASLMPPTAMLVPGIEVASRFVAAAEGLDVGGDFYDVFRLGTVDDPAPTWALVIGDVRGKGADAAAITGIARATVRATALDERSPARMLERLNQVLLAAAEDDRFASETGEPRFCTACVVTVTPGPRGADIVVAVGGHPLPYVVRATGHVETAGRQGGLIGVLRDPEIVDVPMRLGAGDALVLFTDGVTERHANGRFFDDGGLVGTLALGAGPSAEAVAGRVEYASRTFVDSDVRDDLAILVARVPDATTGAVARLELPPTEQAAALARHFVRDALVEIGASNILDAAALLTSELVANALMHGAPPLSVEVLAVDSGVRVAVSDAHPDLPNLRGTVSDDEHGRGLLLVEALASAWGVDANPPGKAVWFQLDV